MNPQRKGIALDSAMKALWIFTDFDGTISEPDTIDLLGKLFDKPAERAEMERKLDSGLLEPRDSLAWEIGLVNAPLQEILGLLGRKVVVDPSFAAFVSWCRTRNIPLTIISNGLEEIIRHLLGQSKLGPLQIEANHLEKDSVPWKIIFRDDSAWGHDKSTYLKECRRKGYTPVLVGDGLSDRDAAVCAEIVFAKKYLAAYCEQEGLKYYPFNSFGDIRMILEQVLDKA